MTDELEESNFRRLIICRPTAISDIPNECFEERHFAARIENVTKICLTLPCQQRAEFLFARQQLILINCYFRLKILVNGVNCWALLNSKYSLLVTIIVIKLCVISTCRFLVLEQNAIENK